jgi:periplasmic copper chaperone A
MKIKLSLVPVLAAAVFFVTTADAHVSATGPGFANTTQEVTFPIAHGCNGSTPGDDTYAVTIDIPAGVTSVRPMRSDFGKVSVVKDASNNVTSITWQKPLAEALDGDWAFHKLVVRMKLPNAPFTTIAFPAHQTCRSAAGALSYVEWVAPPGAVTPDGGVAPEPAPTLMLLPARTPGWNKLTIPAAIPDVSVFFKDALVVWKGTAAYSSNPLTAAQLKTEPGVTVLTALAAGDEVSVKY